MKDYSVPTSDLLRKLLSESNPVTRCVLAQIIGKRVDRPKTSKD